MTSYFKACRPDGTDFWTGEIDYAAALATGTVLQHPRPGRIGGSDAGTYFSVATVSTDCTGMQWDPLSDPPMCLYRVQPVGDWWVPDPLRYRHKVACHRISVTAELAPHTALGPQGEAVAALLARAAALTRAEVRALAPSAAVWDAAWDASWAAAWDAARAVIVRDLITPDHYRKLTSAWAKVIGPAHPDDAPVQVSL